MHIDDYWRPLFRNPSSLSKNRRHRLSHLVNSVKDSVTLPVIVHVNHHHHHHHHLSVQLSLQTGNAGVFTHSEPCSLHRSVAAISSEWWGTGVWVRSPQRRPEAEPLVMGAYLCVPPTKMLGACPPVPL